MNRIHGSGFKIPRPQRLDDLLSEDEKKEGRWQLSRNHELVYRSNAEREEFKWRGALVAAEPDALVVSVTRKQSDQRTVTRLARLKGRWKVDSRNRLQFEAQRESGRSDVLTFRSGWRISDRNEIVYTYTTRELKTKAKRTHELVFEGFWDVSRNNGLAYLVGADGDSGFRFRGAFQTKSVLAKEGEIRYQIGVEATGKRERKTLVLFGRWVVSRDFGVRFEMESSAGKRAIAFGADWDFGDSKHVVATLKSREGEPLGLELVFTNEFFKKDGHAFVRFLTTAGERRVEAGTKAFF